MRVFTTVETEWHDGPKLIVVPAGEPCQTVLPKDIPIDDRGTIEAGIRQYASQGRTFRAIKIRDWFAMIETSSLSFIVPKDFKENAPKERARTGANRQQLATCPTV
ncbi:MAG: hypothetical protein V4719_26495 [Planctomycetota bacterium]